MKLLEHQVKYAKDYPDKAFLVHEGGTGKTVCASVWLRDGRDADALVVCPKRIVRKWKAALSDWQTKATVATKDEFKKMPPKEWSAVVFDESDEFAAPLFCGKGSQLADFAYNLVREYPDMPVALLSATPIRSTPWNLHTQLCLLGSYVEWKEWRARFFELRYPSELPYLVRPSWLEKPNWREEIRKELEKHADIVLLKDIVEDVPPVEEIEIHIKTHIPPDALDFHDVHRAEQVNKLSEVKAIGKEYRKVIVVAYYTEQVESLAKELKKERQTFMVHGKTKKQEEVLEEAAQSDECYLVIQASLGAGFDGDSFSCVVFASMAFAVRDFAQMKYRVRRIHNLHPVQYNFLLGGKCDRQVLKNIQAGKNFVPSEWDPYDDA